jgi:hypothetical protein
VKRSERGAYLYEKRGESGKKSAKSAGNELLRFFWVRGIEFFH